MRLCIFIGLMASLIMGMPTEEQRTRPTQRPLWLKDNGKPTGMGDRGSPLKCRGLPCDEFERMAAKVKQYKKLVAIRQGHNPDEVDDNPLIGDIALTEEQADYLLAKENGESLDNFKIVQDNRLWGKRIPYQIDYSAFSSSEVAVLKRGLQWWSDNSCINFVEERPISGNYFWVQREDSGCWSYIGRTGSGAVAVNYGRNCISHVLALHEFGHTLGMYHEQSRPDRDDFIRILWENIESGWESEFQIASNSITRGVRYDYASIMHYWHLSASKNDKETMMPYDLGYYSTIGNEYSGSFFDIAIINDAYKCADACSGRTCQNGGIPNSRSCSNCICPEGLGGSDCTNGGVRSSGCSPSSGRITVTSSEQCVTSPGYPDGYRIGDQCNWLLQASGSSSRIEYYFKGTYGIVYDWYGADPYSEYCWHWVEIKDGPDKAERGYRYCGANRPTWTKRSTSNSVVVSFMGDTFDGWTDRDSGFQLCFRLASFEDVEE